MFRHYDFECSDCGDVHGDLIDVPSGSPVPQVLSLECPACGSVAVHDRLMSCPAPYMGERVYNPMVSGGSFDTTGHRELPSLPDLPPGVDATSKNYKQLFASGEYREAKALRSSIQAQNIEKRKRAAAIRRGGTVNMRNDKCAGDPNIVG